MTFNEFVSQIFNEKKAFQEADDRRMEVQALRLIPQRQNYHQDDEEEREDDDEEMEDMTSDIPEPMEEPKAHRSESEQDETERKGGDLKLAKLRPQSSAPLEQSLRSYGTISEEDIAFFQQLQEVAKRIKVESQSKTSLQTIASEQSSVQPRLRRFTSEDAELQEVENPDLKKEIDIESSADVERKLEIE